jgi:hypothetical protein
MANLPDRKDGQRRVDHWDQSGHFYLAESGHFYLGITCVDAMGSILLSVGAVSDVGGKAIVGSSLGAAGGVVLLPAMGIGWGIGTLLNPYIQPIISSWYGY